MTRFVAPLAAAAIFIGTAASFSSEGPVPADVKEKITAQLTQDGYDLRKIEMEDGAYEAYALKDGARFEIYFNSALEIIRTKADD